MTEPLFLVVGPESSGTRFMAEVMVRDCKCHGSFEHSQEFDIEQRPFVRFPRGLERPMLRRSYPHGTRWPSLDSLRQEAAFSGYRPFIVVIQRQWNCLIKSKLRNGRAGNLVEAMKRTRKAYIEIFKGIGSSPYLVIDYEAMGDHRYREWLYQKLGVQGTPTAKWRDENAKYQESKT